MEIDKVSIVITNFKFTYQGPLLFHLVQDGSHCHRRFEALSGKGGFASQNSCTCINGDGYGVGRSSDRGDHNSYRFRFGPVA